MQRQWLGSILDYSIHHDDYKPDASDTSGEPCSMCLRAMVNDFMEGDESARDDDAFNIWCGDLSAAAILHYDSSNANANVDGRTSSYKSAYCGKNASIAIKELEWVLKAAAKGVEPELEMEIEKTMREMKGLHLRRDGFDEATRGGDVEAAPESTQRRRRKELTTKHPRSTAPNVLTRLRDRLRSAGYDAGICKSEVRMIDGVGLIIGGHEYVDVVMEESKRDKYGDCKRIVVDVGFGQHFQIARPSAAYKRMQGMLPETYVGSGTALWLVVRIMCAAARDSMRSEFEGIWEYGGVPPWRRRSFLQSKWSHRYTRTTSSSSSEAAINSPPRTPPEEWKPPPVPCRRPAPPPFGPGALSRSLACLPAGE